MNLKKLIKSRTFIVLSASTILLSTIICYLIFNPKTPITTPHPKTSLTTEELNPTDAKSYLSALQKWKDQCFFKPEKIYTSEEIRQKLGRENRTLFFIPEFKNSVITQNNDMKRLGDWTPDITPYDNAIYYYYDKGLFSDEWYFHRRFTEFPRSLLSSKFDRDVLVLGITKNRFLDNLFYH